MLLAQAQNALKDATDIFGKVEVKTGPSILYDKPVSESLATIFVFGIRFVFVIAGLAVLVYMLWGALEYITSGGDPDNTAKARQKIINALIGLILLIAALALWLFVTSIFGIVQRTPDGGFKFSLPRLSESSSSGSGTGTGTGSGIPPCNPPGGGSGQTPC